MEAAARISSAGFARSAASESAPTAEANFTPSSSAAASARIGSGPAPKNAPLSPIAFWTSPFASGEATSALTEKDPADSPKIVTFPGSPPKAAMLSCTQRRAATWSSRP
ncbi:MAG: hypothetical protein H6Q10_1904 [Acidobacteria bacterium]|nr:hypothetical protein [Acidobacteriota bacterium]